MGIKSVETHNLVQPKKIRSQKYALIRVRQVKGMKININKHVRTIVQLQVSGTIILTHLLITIFTNWDYPLQVMYNPKLVNMGK